MLSKQAITKKLNISSAKAWEAIRGIDGLDRWFPINMTLEGGQITDLIEAVDDSRRRFVYLRTTSPFPVTHYRGTVEIFDSYDG